MGQFKKSRCLSLQAAVKTIEAPRRRTCKQADQAGECGERGRRGGGWGSVKFTRQSKSSACVRSASDRQTQGAQASRHTH